MPNLFWEAMLLFIWFSSHMKNIVSPITNPIEFFTSEENHIRFYCHFMGLVAVNTNMALLCRLFWNANRRVQETKKISISQCKTSKYQELKQHKHNNCLCEGKLCNCVVWLKSLLKSGEWTFPVNWLHLSYF